MTAPLTGHGRPGTGPDHPADPVHVLAFAQELSDHPTLLAQWTETFSGEDPITLIIHPGELSGQQATEIVTALVTAAGVEDDDGSASLILMTGPLSADDDQRLLHRCAAVFTNGRAPEPFDRLSAIRPDAGTDLRALLLPAAGDRAVEPTTGDRGGDAQAQGLQQVELPGGHRIWHRGTEADVSVIRDIFLQHCYSPAQNLKAWSAQIGRLADPATLGGTPLVVDLGANIGVSAMYFRLAYPDARVVAVEPESENFSLLSANLRPFDGISTRQEAISDERGTLVLSDPGTGGWAFRTGTEIALGAIVGEVPATTIDDVVDAEPETVPFLLKVDIEGAEQRLFKSRWETLARFPIVIVELHDWLLPGRGTSHSFLSWHVAQRRELIHVGENIFSLDAARLQTA